MFEGHNITENKDKSCMNCSHMPDKCRCGGYIHNEIVWNISKNDSEALYWCDKCGNNYKW